MSNFTNDIRRIFSPILIENQRETQKESQFFLNSLGSILPDKVEFQNAIKVNDRDVLNIKLISEGDTEFIYESDKGNFDELFDKIVELQNGDLNNALEFIIYKNIASSTISIYELDCFNEYLLSLSFIDFFQIFHGLIKSNQGIRFEIQNENVLTDLVIQTWSIQFLIPNSEQRSFNRIMTHFEKSKSVCHSNFVPNLELSPKDFHPIVLSSSSTINEKFLRASMILSLGFLFDITTLDNENFYFKLNGYRTIARENEVKNFDISSEKLYFDIFNWCYEGGNIIDKIGLSRNIVSLNLIDEFAKISPTTFESIRSSFNIYLKENIKQYIDIRNKASDQLWELQNKAEKITETFVSDMKKNIFAFISFFASVIAIRVITKGDFKGAFTYEAASLILVVLLISCVILFASYWEVSEQIKRFRNFYKNFKIRYKDLLTSDDIRMILKDDEEFKQNVRFISSKQKLYSIVWAAIIVILFVTTIILNHYCDC